MHKSPLLVVPGSQLFSTKLVEAELKKADLSLKGLNTFMCEDFELCTRFKYHKHKIILSLAAMREHALKLEKAGGKLHYIRLKKNNPEYFSALAGHAKKIKAKTLVVFDVEDKFFETRLRKLSEDENLTLVELKSPMFLQTRAGFTEYLKSVKKPFMKTFYQNERRRLGIMMEGNEPLGGKFSFDSENRKKLPTKLEVPAFPKSSHTKITREVIAIVDEFFPTHPGDSQKFWLPVTSQESKEWLQRFVKDRFALFGNFQDAISKRTEFGFHSVLSPMINIGLLTPKEVIDFCIEQAEEQEIPLNSLEGFIRQLIGWREFVRGIYQNFSEKQDQENFWKHTLQPAESWYLGETGIDPLDDCIIKAQKYGYNHHIERLMIISNIMLLSELNPRHVHGWFMEMYVDSSDWVMGPNVYGMGQFSDGGLFATKPYICGSNYIIKMSDYKKGDWAETLDGLYWRFIYKHQKFFASNPRLSMMARMLGRLKPERKERIFALADEFIQRNTISP